MVDVSKLWAAGMEKALLIVVIAGGVCCLPDSNQNLTTSERYYVNIGDGTSTQFDFPENTNGIIVVSSRYRAATEKGCTRLIVESLDPDVLKIINVTDAETIGLVKSYIVSIKSRLAGTAPLLIRLLDVARVKPLTVEERKDYIIKVSPSNDLSYNGLVHFSQNPVLYFLLPLIFINKCAFGCKVEIAVLRGILKQPHPVILGVIGQFVLMPLYGYILSRIFSLPKALSLGLAITCSAPGGGGGYLYSLLLGGDVTLAISMTLISTLVATGLSVFHLH